MSSWTHPVRRDLADPRSRGRVLRCTGQILRNVVRHRMGRTVVYVAGMESTGSTLLYQLVRGLGADPIKVHGYPYGPARKLVTIRDPRDVLCSYARRQHRSIAERDGLEEALLASLRTLFHEFRRQDDLRRFREDGCSLLLRYEDYVGGSEARLLDVVAGHLEVELDPDRRSHLVEDASLERNAERARAHADFSGFDPETHVHGHHISSGGRTGVWRTCFTERVVDRVREDLGDLLVELGYETTDAWCLDRPSPRDGGPA